MNVIRDYLLSVEPESIVNPLSHEFKRRLGSESILTRHVKIIDETDSFLFGVLGSVFILGSSFEIALDNFLSVD